MTQKPSLTWEQFWEERGGRCCPCPGFDCGAELFGGCDRCGGPLVMRILTNAPTLVVGCRKCGIGLRLAIVPGTKRAEAS